MLPLLLFQQIALNFVAYEHWPINFPTFMEGRSPGVSLTGLKAWRQGWWLLGVPPGRICLCLFWLLAASGSSSTSCCGAASLQALLLWSCRRLPFCLRSPLPVPFLVKLVPFIFIFLAVLVFVAVQGFSSCGAQGYSVLWCMISLRWVLLLWFLGSRSTGSVVVAHGLLIAVGAFVGGHGLSVRGFSS